MNWKWTTYVSFVECRSSELSNLKLRRSEKKQLNQFNHSESSRYHVMNNSKAGKILDRIAAADQKIFILVCSTW